MKFYVAIFSLLIILSVMLSLNQASAAPTISIETSQSVYEYGDRLVMIINVSEVTGDDVRIYITDPAERKSLLLQQPMSYVYTEFPARFPLDSAVWKPGTYLLELVYSGVKSSVQFTIEETGIVSLPFWIKDLAKMWINEPLVTDKDFARAIEYLIQVEIIKIPYTEPGGETESGIPEWVKNNAGWWIEGKISDTEFTMALQYLVKIGIIKVNVSTLEAT
jgi:hypothetical protein